MTPLIEPAKFAIRSDGVLYSLKFGDVYHSAAGCFGQTRHVFLNGNGLPERWRARRVFTIVETGFGLGLNFISTWALWRNDPARCNRLHFVSIEKHPFTRADLAALLPRIAHPDIAPLANQLLAHWPVLAPGLHRIEFEQGGVILTLAFGDIAEQPPALSACADAFYLDGFAPVKNPEMWSAATFKSLARLAARNATLATYTSASAVRRGLTDAGFEVRRATGYGGKREMTVGRFISYSRAEENHARLSVAAPQRHAIVIGAGLAGCAVVERLAARGWQITLIERRAQPARETSGHTAGLFHPLITKQEGVKSRLTRAGFLYALRNWQALASRTSCASPLQAFSERANGLLHLRESEDNDLAHVSVDLPKDYVRCVSRAEAKTLAGVRPASGGFFFPAGGRCDPVLLCRAQLEAAGQALTAHWMRPVARLVREADHWHAVDQHGLVIACAPVVIIAAAHHTARLGGLRDASARAVRGQLTIAPRIAQLPLALPVIGGGYAVPLPDQKLMIGASYDFDDDPLPRALSHMENLSRLHRLFPDTPVDIDLASLTGAVGFRCIARDRLPLIGALADERQPDLHRHASDKAHLSGLHRQPGLYGAFAYGSRGLIWAALAGELIACAIEREPMPIEAELINAVDPARFLLKMRSL
ncbi:tRNA 5-methylaminomethyl-2-thiouridine biosynthesis bifunctional protein mnmC [Candidatus Glomeribacter gigasporarum BEG34]|uniref:tRNA 5-methylaminomethyl-2-thiouridine biosynthesis bifunctional protein MnmC n=1 Tax=Candidatus Glomeribacter gigasporarum BEG34 TaxID=1070319 RepID=G2J7X0_9BURK|nr:bifunctional tRNA (5-methylaminomethyl-2-thiouridine)(34)-methyltransferase MnmD/FAD-dependent 5-carboxymethylaminomethyl-2-thiouridine(34) oxidoreductase MnmC [Candidatus Glomeribacter gigasporarum]CCD28865.1 tRNA 5-methylaminomethyl-2-thiouridine biosynthesis bifunctional protein mnmC [Candidatus Glomeribacter gigasporarum BEG34]